MAYTAGTAWRVRFLGIGFGACLVAAPMLSAQAQGVGAGGMGNGGFGAGSSMMRRGAEAANAPKKRERMPDTLPGAKARAPVAPASKTPSDLAPNEAMFDAINRGDIGTVKDALSRGARLDARNVLGMTPLELSVDLGRNDISFLLLSMRGEGAAPPRDAGQQVTQKATAAELKAAQTARPRGARVAPAPAPVAAKAVSTPKLFANDGGSPVPNAGFLGFDPRGGTN